MTKSDRLRRKLKIYRCYLLKSVNKDIEYKHKELQNLMRIQEDRSRRNSIRIEGTVELPKENWKDTENKFVRCCTTTVASQKE